MPGALMPPREQGPASHGLAPVRHSPGGAVGKTGGAADIPRTFLPEPPCSPPPCQALTTTPPSPRQRPHPRAPPAGFSELTSVRELVCLFSNRWCCSAIPMATALGVLPPPGELPGTCPCPLPAPAGSRTRPGGRGAEGRAGLRMLGLPRRTRPCTSPRGGPTGRGEAAPGCSTAPPRPRLWPAGPALLLGLPETTLQSRSGPGATCQPHGRPTPAVLRAGAPAKPQLPVQLPPPTAAPSPFQALTPSRPSEVPLTTASTLPS